MDKKQGPPDSDGVGLTLDELMFVGAPSVCSPETQAKIVEEARNRLENRRGPSPKSRPRLVSPKASWFRRFLREPFFSTGAFGGAVAASFILAFGYMRLFGPAVSPVLLQEQLTFKGGARIEKKLVESEKLTVISLSPTEAIEEIIEDPRRMLEVIRGLRDNGNLSGARALYTAFTDLYPDYAVPEKLKTELSQ
jgi:hypothetical protein